MDWERPLMEAHAEAVCCCQGNILNVGFGLGLIDEAIQKRNPVSHTIVEAHPDVYKRMLELGWGNKQGVTVIFGRWQEVLTGLGPFDGIFFDTYGEYFSDMRDFHALLPKILKPGGIYSFFNGLAPTNAFFHSVYCHIVDMEMQAVGFQTSFIPLPVDVSNKNIWTGVRHRYWWNDTYFLPVCQFSMEKGDHDVLSSEVPKT